MEFFFLGNMLTRVCTLVCLLKCQIIFRILFLFQLNFYDVILFLRTVLPKFNYFFNKNKTFTIIV